MCPAGRSRCWMVVHAGDAQSASVPCSRNISAYTRRWSTRPTRSIWTKSQAMMASSCADRNSRHVGPLRRGAGSMPAAVWISQTVVAPRECPSWSSSLWIRRQSHRGFSLGRRRSNFRVSSGIGGRPGFSWETEGGTGHVDARRVDEHANHSGGDGSLGRKPIYQGFRSSRPTPGALRSLSWSCATAGGSAPWTVSAPPASVISTCTTPHGIKSDQRPSRWCWTCRPGYRCSPSPAPSGRGNLAACDGGCPCSHPPGYHRPWTNVITSALPGSMPSRTLADQQCPVPASSAPWSLPGATARTAPAHKRKSLF